MGPDITGAWTPSTLGQVATWLSGGTPSKANPAFWAGALPWVSPKDMKVFRLGDTEDHISDRGAESGSRTVPGGAVFVVVRGMILAHTFPVCLAGREMAFNQDVKAGIPGPGLSGGFLGHWLVGNSHGLLGIVTEATHGTKRIELRDFTSFKIRVPTPPEQARIAEVLDTLDDAIRTTEQVIAKLEMVKRGLMHDLLTNGIDENGELRDPVRHPERFKDSPLGRVPSEWEPAPLRDLCERITDGTHQTVHTTERMAGTVPFLYVSSVRDGRVRWDDAGRIDASVFRQISLGREPRAGMVLYTAVGSYGHAAVVEAFREFSFQRHLACLYPRPALNGRFLAEWLNSAAGRSFANKAAIGNAQKTVTLTALKSCVVPLPPLAEQLLIGARAAGLSRLLDAQASTLAKLRLLKKGLADDLLTGRVRVAVASP